VSAQNMNIGTYDGLQRTNTEEPDRLHVERKGVPSCVIDIVLRVLAIIYRQCYMIQH
ncbi:hypothetical protein Tco_1537491, partial [Tanacetum coccineum]